MKFANKKNHDNHGKRNKNNTKTTKKPTNTKDKKVIRFHPTNGTNPNHLICSFETVQDGIERKIMKDITDYPTKIVETIRELKKVDYDKLKPSKAEYMKKPADGKEPVEFINDPAANQYYSLLNSWKKKSELYNENLQKAAAIIYSDFCTETMQSRIEADVSREDRRDPVLLLKAIKRLMHSVQKAKHPMIGLWTMIVRLTNCKQMSGETHMDYVKRFKEQRDIVEGALGTEYLDKFLTENFGNEIDEYITRKHGDSPGPNEIFDATEEWLKGHHEAAMAILMLLNSDRDKYGSLLTTLAANYGRNLDQYPTTVESATDALTTHSWDATYKDKKRNNANKQQKDKKPNKDHQKLVTSFFCLSFAVRQIRCYKCGEAGHRSDQCKKQGIKDDEWWIHKAAQNHAAWEDSQGTDDGNRKDPARKWKVKE